MVQGELAGRLPSNWYPREKHGWSNYRQADINREVEINFSVRDNGLVELRLKHPDVFEIKG
ncbi:hypothetical protein [Roseateles sp.]|uniref:hypothetical protein n=1 Tax=Roseateles sp. TaxID=1971397 RepID=UPI0031CEFB94